MIFNADLHIHSKYSRATAKNLDFENLYQAAQIKGLTVVGTGDFTFPAWVDEIESKLEAAEPGLFRLKPEIARDIDSRIPRRCRNPVRFILQTEISNIYKKDGRVRKNHNVVFFPDLAGVKKFNARLDAIGNIKSDGRPILGLDARNLLEIVLETDDRGFLVPAHIWTPWFSMFGSKSGFDRMADCFGDLTPHIFACETGLSSDPPMNWRVTDLDHVRLISNSDAHSPGYLGRNASVFGCELDYFAMRAALESLDLDGYRGTLDMYPDQGKYHYDGHRKCGVRLNPDESAQLDGICPECGKPLTLGVLHRVRELADRPEGFVAADRQGYTPIVPLADILSEIFGVGPKTKKVTGYFQKAVAALGPELAILTDLTVEDIASAGVPLLAEAVSKMRSGDIRIDPGYDGEFGTVGIFSSEEKQRLSGENNLLFKTPRPRRKKAAGPAPKKKQTILRKKKEQTGEQAAKQPAATGLLEGLNPEQRQAVASESRAILITAGPGTGKTRTLTARIAHLVSQKGIPPEQILALTFTNKAARELSQRMAAFGGEQVMAATFHGFCLNMLKAYGGLEASLVEDETRRELVKTALETVTGKTTGLVRQANRLDGLISLCKQRLLGPGDDLSAVDREEILLPSVFSAYQQLLTDRGLVDFEELIFRFHGLMTDNPEALAAVQQRFPYIFIDEYQDLNLGQYLLVKQLARQARIMVIGDPDQSIYGFRGSDNRYFRQFTDDYPGCEQIVLNRNYRSTQTILDASFQMISKSDGTDGSQQIFSQIDGARRLIIKETASEAAEAVAVGKIIEAGIGGLSFFSMDARQSDDLGDKSYAFSDFAVLYRTRKQWEAFARVFDREGIPFQTADKGNDLDLDGIRELLSCFRILTRRAAGRDISLVADCLGISPEPDLIRTPARILAPVHDQIRGLNSRECLERLSAFLGIAETGAEKEIAAREKLYSLAAAFETPEEFMDRLALDQDPDHLSDGAEKVSLMTMHAAKGLEFPVVFVTGCEQGLVPFARDGETVEDAAEERRLFYVAMTRAMDILCLTYAQKRRIYGTNQKRQRSFFIDDIEKRLARYEKRAPMARVKKRETQLELF